MDLRKGISTGYGAANRLYISHLAGFVVFLLLQSLPLIVPDLRLSGFSVPAARAAAAFLGAPVLIESGSVILAHPTIDVAITEACSGFQFFTLLTGFLVGFVFFRNRSTTLLRDVFLVPVAAYGLTLACNASRIVGAVQIRSATRDDGRENAVAELASWLASAQSPADLRPSPEEEEYNHYDH